MVSQLPFLNPARKASLDFAEKRFWPERYLLEMDLKVASARTGSEFQFLVRNPQGITRSWEAFSELILLGLWWSKERNNSRREWIFSFIISLGRWSGLGDKQYREGFRSSESHIYGRVVIQFRENDNLTSAAHWIIARAPTNVALPPPFQPFVTSELFNGNNSVCGANCCEGRKWNRVFHRLPVSRHSRFNFCLLKYWCLPVSFSRFSRQNYRTYTTSEKGLRLNISCCCKTR